MRVFVFMAGLTARAGGRIAGKPLEAKLLEQAGQTPRVRRVRSR